MLGGLVGHERFEYTSTAPAGKLSGDGTSIGGYAGWKADDVVLSLGVVHTALNYDVVSGNARGSFSASRWLVTGGIAGEFTFDDFTIRPSARLFGLWESEDDYVDSLDNAHAARDFDWAQGSAGLLVSRALPIAEDWQLTPYVGLYLDAGTEDDIGSDDDVGRATARVTGGFDVTAPTGARLGFDGQIGGIGSDVGTWSARSSLRSAF